METDEMEVSSKPTPRTPSITTHKGKISGIVKPNIRYKIYSLGKNSSAALENLQAKLEEI